MLRCLILSLFSLCLTACETAEIPPGQSSPLPSHSTTPASHQNANPSMTAGKMMSPLM